MYGLILMTAVLGQPPQDMLAARVESLEARVAALEGKNAPAASGKTTYAEAYRQSLATGLPLLVWNGAAVCPPCVSSSSGEFVHFVGTVPGLPTDAITLSVPDGGEMLTVGVVDRWVGGDATYGHLPSVRRALARWRARRQVTMAADDFRNGSFVAAGYARVAESAPAVSYYSVPLSAAPCATCGNGGMTYRRR